MKTVYEYIRFEGDSEFFPSRKTKVFTCDNTNTGVRLGTVSWSRAWRQYCFEPAVQTVFSKSCLLDICDFINQLMEERKT